jgi:hypothetical protein
MNIRGCMALSLAGLSAIGLGLLHIVTYFKLDYISEVGLLTHSTLDTRSLGVDVSTFNLAEAGSELVLIL